jgi:hypothetical protein
MRRWPASHGWRRHRPACWVPAAGREGRRVRLLIPCKKL